jgi:hypothetical protein
VPKQGERLAARAGLRQRIFGPEHLRPAN